MKRERKCFVRESDYERYTVHLPLMVILKRNKNRYLYSELEKMHPCFSDDCCFDSREKLRDGRFASDVVVMNKFVLAEYRKVNADGKVFLDRKRELFVSETTKKIKTFSGILIVLCVTGLIFGSLHFVMERKNQSKKALEKEISLKTEAAEKFSYYDLSGKFFAVLEEKNGFVDSFEWNCDDKYEYLTASVNYLYPEDFEKMSGIRKVSAMKIKDEKPYFVVDFVNRKEDFVREKTDEKINRQKLRNILKNEGFVITEEEIEPVCYRFYNKTILEKEGNFLCDFETALQESGLEIKSISLKGDGENGLNGEMTLCEKGEIGKGLNLEVVDKNLQLFTRKTGTQKEIKNQSEVVVEKKSVPGMRVGEIRKKDGTKVIFYKNENGKIFKVEN